jgi:hypothetical protein
MALEIDGWTSALSTGLAQLFDGSDHSIDMLTELIKDGRLLEGTDFLSAAFDEDDIANRIERIIFAHLIARTWTVAGLQPFILDTGDKCDLIPGVKGSSCFEGNWYRLVYGKVVRETCPDGGSPPHTNPPPCLVWELYIPPGASALNGKDWGGITIDDIVHG